MADAAAHVDDATLAGWHALLAGTVGAPSPRGDEPIRAGTATDADRRTVGGRRDTTGDRAMSRDGAPEQADDGVIAQDARPTTARRASRIRVPQVRIDVTVAMSTLLGLDEHPAELAGFGPIGAEQARALAAGGVGRRLGTDPLSRAVLAVGRTRYRPPRPIAEHVVARDTTRAAPGCSVPAPRCDPDHTTEYRVAPGRHGHVERLGAPDARSGTGYPDERPF